MAAVKGKIRETIKRDAKETADDKLPLKLRQLKERLRPLVNHQIYGRKLDLSDVALSKWLKVSEFDVIMADAKMRKSLEFREQMSVDKLLKEYKPPDCILDYYAGGLCGVDKSGSPVYYELYGLLNLKSLLKVLGKGGLIKYKLYQHEKILQYLKKLSKRKGKTIDAILMIVDLQFSTKEHLFSSEILLWSEILELLVEHYPCLFKEILLINTPDWQTDLRASLQPYLSKDARNLVNVLEKNVLPGLLHRIQKKHIPAYLGGEKSDLDTHKYCRLNVDYWNMQIPGWMKVTDARNRGDNAGVIAPGVRKIQDYNIQTASTTISWQFSSVSQSVVFSIYQSSLGNRNRVVTSQLSPNESQTEEGQMVCPAPGRYLVVIDNRANSNKQTQLVYQILIREPEVENLEDKDLSKDTDTSFSLLPKIEKSRGVTREDYLRIVKGADSDWLHHF
ncbi:SEC14-like protein 3 [Biomphalaria glabrata]|nr:SEC14-like protein 3 [Biomphalaria glabrata]